MKIGTIITAIEDAMLENFSIVTRKDMTATDKGYSIHYRIPGTDSNVIYVVCDSTGYVVYYGWPDKGVQVFSGSIDGKRIETFDPKRLEEHYRDTWAESVSPYFVEFFRDVTRTFLRMSPSPEALVFNHFEIQGPNKPPDLFFFLFNDSL